MIRRAELKDLDAIVDIGLEFAVKSQAIHTFTASPEKIREVAKLAITDSGYVMLVLELGGKVEGVVFGVVLAAFFSTDLVLQELALYSRKATGVIPLLEAFEKEAHDLKVTKIVVGSKPDYCNLGKLYLRRGYRMLEEHYIKIGG